MTLLIAFILLCSTPPPEPPPTGMSEFGTEYRVIVDEPEME